MKVVMYLRMIIQIKHGKGKGEEAFRTAFFK